MKSKETRKLILRYTLVFIVTFVMVFSFFVTYGKSFVWKKDGLYQHFNAFVYFGQYVREFFRELFVNHKFIVKMWEPGFGYGADVFTTLSYYSIGDPFAFVAVFFKSSACEIGYSLAIVLRFYAAGLAFMAYCLNRGRKGNGVLCGAILYTFCSFALFAGVRHPYFINPMIYLPLLYLGVDKIKRNEKPIVYILAVFVSAISNFYFLYMLVLLTVIYVVIRTLCDRKERTVKVLFKRVCLYAGYGLLGILMASILFVPNALNFLSNERIADVYMFPPLYSLTEYRRLFVSLMGTSCGPFWAYIGLAPIAYIGAFVFLYSKKGWHGLWQKIYLGLLFIFLLIPYAGYAFNGFGYVCNRWVFAWSFVIAYLFVEGYDILVNISSNYIKPLMIAGGTYIVLAIIFSKFTSPEVYIQSLFIVLIIFLLKKSIGMKEVKLFGKVFTPIQFKKSVSIILVVASVFSMGIYRFSGYARDYLSTFRDIGTAYELLTGERANTFSLIQDDDENYRIDNNTYGNMQANYMPSMKHSTTSVYFSLINPYISQYSRENSLYFEASYEQRGLNNRSYLMPLAGVKYYVTDRVDVLIPYGYEKYGYTDESSKYYIYKNDTALPMIYGYDHVFDEEYYKQATVYEKQQLLLSSAVVNDGKELPSKTITQIRPNYFTHFFDYGVANEDGAKLENGKITVTKEEASITFKVPRINDNEVYVYFKGLKFESDDVTNSAVTGSMGHAKDMFYVFTNRDIYAEERNEFMLNLGMNNKTDTVTVQFSGIGEYTFDKLNIVAMPVAIIPNLTDKLRVDYTNMVSGTNTFAVDFSVDSEKLVCLSIPYSKGFRAFMDGREVDLYRVNTMFMGVLCNPGEHHLQLWYRTPFLMTGINLTVVGILIFIFVCIYYNRFWKREGANKNKEKSSAPKS